MNQLLKSQGWIYVSACRCGGSLREHHHHDSFPGYEIRIRPTKQTFTILNKGMQVAGPDHGYKLETKMKELEIWQ